MDIKRFFKSNLFKIFNYISCLFIIVILLNYMRFDIILEHDRLSVFMDPIEIVSVGSIPTKFFWTFFYQTLPSLLPSININDMQNTIIALFKAVIMLGISYTFAKIFFVFKNSDEPIIKRKSFSILLLLSFFIVFCSYGSDMAILHSEFQIHNSKIFFDWGLSLLLFSYLFYILSCLYIIHLKLSKVQYILSFSILFLLSSSNKIYAFVLFSCMCFLFLYELIKILKIKLDFSYFVFWKRYRQLSFSFSIKNDNKKEEEILNTAKSLCVKILPFIIFMFCFLVIFIYINSEEIFETMYAIYYIYSIDAFQANFFDFLYIFYNTYIVQLWYYYAVLILLIMFLYYKKIKNYKVVTVYLLISVLSLLFVYFLCFFFGKVYNSNFFISTPQMIYTFVKIFKLFIILLLGYIFYNCEFNKKIEITDTLLISSLFIIGLFLISILPMFIKNYNIYISLAKRIRLVSFVSDKTALFYNNLDGKIVLPINYYNSHLYSCLLYKIKYGCVSYDGAFDKMITIKQKESLKEKTRIYTSDLFESSDLSDNFYFEYLKRVYDIEPDTLEFKPIGYINKELQNRNSKIITAENNYSNLWFSTLSKELKTLDYYNKLVEDNPDKAWAWASRGRFLRYIYPDKALSDLNKAIELDNNNVSYYFIRGLLLKYLKHNEAAAKDLNYVILHNEYGIVVYDILSRLYANVGDYKNAFKVLDIVIKKFPYGYIQEGKDFYFQRAELKELIGDKKGALQDYLSSARVNDYAIVLNVNLRIANIQQNLGDYSEAILNYDEELEYNPENTIVYYYRGAAYYNNKQYDYAIDDFIRYLESIHEINNTERKNIKQIKIYYNYLRKNKIKAEKLKKLRDCLNDELLY